MFEKSYARIGQMIDTLSDYVTLIVNVPETHAEQLREVMAQAGAGRFGNYTHCSWSTKGLGRFRPGAGANPAIGQQGQLESVVEEQIQTICSRHNLERVLAAIKQAHPYEQMVIDIYPVYQMGLKTNR
jgi:hypothetical protein